MDLRLVHPFEVLDLLSRTLLGSTQPIRAQLGSPTLMAVILTLNPALPLLTWALPLRQEQLQPYGLAQILPRLMSRAVSPLGLAETLLFSGLVLVNLPSMLDLLLTLELSL